MSMRVTKLFLLSAIVVFLSACEKQKITLDDPSADTDAISTLVADMNQSYLVVSKTNKLPSGLEKALADAGGALESTLPEVGIAVATSADPSFMNKASKIKGVGDVVPNLEMDFIDPGETVEFNQDEAGNPPFSDDDDGLFNYQWGHTAIQAVDAWDEGYKGAGVRVGVLDTGFDLNHPDLIPNINFGLSTNFVAGEVLQYMLPDVFSHGTHTAGTIAAADNGFGTIGVAPEAELVLIKVLSDEGSGNSGDIWAGIIHAANVGCDVINMSIGSTFYKSGRGMDIPANVIAAYRTYYNRVVTYAYQQGVTVIASAGNSAIDFDHAADLMHMPSDASNAISISATAPYGWAWDFATNLDEPASYTNFGQSVIDFAAPGGDFDFPDNFWWWDMVMSTGNGGWYWSAGTSMASPHAAGVAALIIGKNGGDMKPAQVKAALRQSADDLGKPGKDDFFGHGRVNAYNAVK